MDKLIQDMRYAIRALNRTPHFALVAVLTLGMGIGASTAVFSLADAVLLRPLPVDRPSELVVVKALGPGGRQTNLSYPMFEQLRDERALSGAFAALDGNLHLPIGPVEGNGQPEERRVHLVSEDYFKVLGVRPVVGRFFAKDSAGIDRDIGVAVLSHDYWQRQFAADPAIAGRTLVIQGQPVSIIGVAPSGFFGETVGRSPDIWVPLAMQPHFSHGTSYLEQANVGWLQVVGRLRAGVSSDQAEAALGVKVSRLRTEGSDVGESARDFDLRLVYAGRGLGEFRERFSLPLLTLLGMVSLVLLLVCANVSNLLLARGTTRRREIGIRVALGAERSRLVAQLFTESAILAALGGLLGLILARWGIDVLLLLASTDGNAIPVKVALDIRVLALTAAICLTTVVLFGLFPALTTSKIEPGESLKTHSRGAIRARASRGFVVVQVAISVVVLTGAALLSRTAHNLRYRDMGFAAGALLEARFNPQSSGYSPEQMPVYSRALLERLNVMPGVESASLTYGGFGTGVPTTCCIAVEGYSPSPREDRRIWTMGVAPAYFRTIQLPLRSGRDFDGHDAVATAVHEAEPSVAIVNEAFVNRYLRGRNPIGARFGWGDPPNVNYNIEIVGVVANAVHDDIREEARPAVYQPRFTGDTFVLRTAVAPTRMAAAIRREFTAIDPDLEVSIRAVSDALDAAVARERLLATLSSFFAVIAAMLAGIGLYGLVTYIIAQRKREIGIRMALGATGRAILLSEMTSALKLTMLGVLIGTSTTLAAGGLLRSQLYGISSTDPITLFGAASLIALLAAASVYLPARRAARVDPAAALACE